MNGWPPGFRTLLDAPNCAPGGERQRGPLMLDGGDGPARLAFESATGWRHNARLDRWLAIVWDQPPRASRGSSGCSTPARSAGQEGVPPANCTAGRPGWRKNRRLYGCGPAAAQTADAASRPRACSGRLESWTPHEYASPLAGSACRPGSG